jgi:hypothetical protein
MFCAGRWIFTRTRSYLVAPDYTPQEWITSLPLHLDLYSALGLEPPEFAHIPILLNPDGTKMSKRNGDVKVEDYIVGGIFRLVGCTNNGLKARWLGAGCYPQLACIGRLGHSIRSRDSPGIRIRIAIRRIPRATEK